ncbi:siderochrome iron transporter 2 [Penicillium argentinense]|uniref:Siderochrome iron transporter 2 n=1 Tax=Penicillium argentinense TaxID=1131581 RepID=A0A9W9FMM6_9EURO|nr:siderochrome iron transporter 2 [Penicillium argentinense]KAJ5103015.1 siderochrome iron transporter 2 [Penicillium argentinense]
MSNRGILRSRTAMSRWPWSRSKKEDVAAEGDGEAQLSGNERSEKEATTHPADSVAAPPPRYAEGPEAKDEMEAITNPEGVNLNAKRGLQKAEAAALVWGKKTVYGLLAWVWVCYMILALHQLILSNITPYVYSNLKTAPQITNAYIISSIIGGVLKLPLAKTLNLWGRAEGLCVSLLTYLLGMIILAAAPNPTAYATGYTIYFIGYDCIYLNLQIFVADTTGLRNRAWALAFSQTPFICTAFTGPLAVNSFLKTSGWRWAFGVFAIVTPFVFGPLAIVFKYYEKQAEKLGYYQKQSSGRTVGQSIIHYLYEFDVIGAFLLMAAFVLFLLPFSLITNGKSSYDSALFIAMVVIGFMLFFVFAAWERWGTRAHFIPWYLLKNSSVLGACLLSMLLFFSFDLWDTYFLQFLYVVYDLDFTQAGYIYNIYTIGSCFWSVPVGIFIYITKRFKYLCLFFGLPLMMLGSGLLIYFRGNDQSIGYIIMCQIFIAFAGGTLVIGEDMAVMAGGDREGIPMTLSLIMLFSSIGGAIGQAVCAAVYNNTFVDALRNALPDDMKSQAESLNIKGYLAQIKYPSGSPIREACAYAWGWSQRQNAIASTALLVLAIPCIMMWKNFNVDKKQNKGNVL